MSDVIPKILAPRVPEILAPTLAGLGQLRAWRLSAESSRFGELIVRRRRTTVGDDEIPDLDQRPRQEPGDEDRVA